MVETFVHILLEMFTNALMVVAIIFIVSVIACVASEKIVDKYIDTIVPEGVPDEELT